MKTITVKIEDKSFDFFLELIKKLDIRVEVQTSELMNEVRKKNTNSPIRIPKSQPSIDDFAGLWEKNPKQLSQIRKKAWTRK